MSHLRSSRALALAGIAVASLGSAASAQAATFNAKASCKYPLIGIQPVDLKVEAALPGWVPEGTADKYPLTVTATLSDGTATAFPNASRLSGTIKPVITKTTTIEPWGDTLSVDEVWPVFATPWNASDPAPNPLVLSRTALTGSIAFDDPGQTDFSLEGLSMTLAALDQAGQPIVIPPLSTDVFGQPYSESDQDKYTFDVSCKLDAGQVTEIFGVRVIGDDMAPSTPTLLAQQPGDLQNTSIRVRWTPSTDNVGVKEYRIWLDDSFVPLARASGSSVEKVIEGLQPGKTYKVDIAAYDLAGNVSARSSIQLSTRGPVIDDFPPTVPANFVASPAPTATSVSLKWDASDARGGTITGYDIYQDDVLVKTVTGTSTTIEGLAPATAYRFNIEANDTGFAGAQKSGRSADLSVVTAGGPGPEPINYKYSLVGSTQLKTLSKGTLPLAGDIDADLTVADGTFVADLALKPTQGRLIALGFLPVTAKVAFVSSGKTTGLLDDGKLTTKSLVRIKLPEVKLFGAIPLAGGNNCQTKQLSTINLASTDTFDPFAGGSLAGTFAISDLNGCGVLNGLVSPLTAGGGNAISLKLTAKPGQ